MRYRLLMLFIDVVMVPYYLRKFKANPNYDAFRELCEIDSETGAIRAPNIVPMFYVERCWRAITLLARARAINRLTEQQTFGMLDS
jgi:hypothetical protein